MKKISLVSICLLIFALSSVYAQTTKVTGVVIDSKTKQPIPFASVLFVEKKDVGVTADFDGKFSLEINSKVAHIEASFIGYITERISIQAGTKQTLTIRLKPDTETLEAATVIGEKQRYRNKDNPAVDLQRLIIEHKNDNRIQAQAYYQVDKYEKLQLSINNVRDSTGNEKGIMKKADFLFQYVDTSEFTGARILPFFFREVASEIYFRKSPKSTKEYVKGERNVDFHHFIDMNSINAEINSVLSPVDLYNNEVMLFQAKFVSPLSPFGPNVFKYHILDTLDVEGVNCIKLSFFPRNPADLAFSGDLFVVNDSSYAIKKIELRTPHNTGINFVRNFKLTHTFNLIDSTWCLTSDQMMVEFVTSSGDKKSLLGSLNASFRNYQFNIPASDKKYAGVASIVSLPGSDQLPEERWEMLRHQKLKPSEEGVFTMVDSLKHVPLFRHTMNAVTLIFSGYSQVGKFDIGPVVSFLSFNPNEGTRLRFGGKTNVNLNRHFFASAYVAYGTKDKELKYNGTLMYSVKKSKKTQWEFPMNLFSVSYQYDLTVPGQAFEFGSGDKLFLSFRRGPQQMMNKERELTFSWDKEYLSGVSLHPSAKWLEQTPQDYLKYVDGQGQLTPKITTAQVGLGLRFAPNESFFQDQMYRYPLSDHNPVFGINHTLALKSVFGGQYLLNRTDLNFNKRFWVAGFGYAEAWIKAGKIWNKGVPFPLLILPQANQNYAYQDEAYNLMNFMEFVNDQYASANLSYCFNGLILNRIPLVSKLKWREHITFKTVWGSLNAANMPDNNAQLFRLPANTHVMESKEPYMEASVAVDNIFKVLRIDLIRRLSHLDNAEIVKWGVCFRLRPRF